MIGVLSYLIFFLILALTFGIAVMGLNLQWGFTGLFNAGVAGFLAVGGYTHAILTGPARDAVFGGFETAVHRRAFLVRWWRPGWWQSLSAS